MISIDQFDYHLPPELIAQFPAEPRDSCRLLDLNRQTGELHHRTFRDLLNLLDANTVIIRNNTKVLPARLLGRKNTGGKCEVLLVHQLESTDPSRTTRWECLTKPGLKANQTVSFFLPGETAAFLTAQCSPDSDFSSYTRVLDFDCAEGTFYSRILELGHTPLPPYITEAPKDEGTLRDIYQTTYAKHVGSVAAPTAGMHFTSQLDEALKAKGVEIYEVTLHVGLGTFLPVQEEQLAQKRLHKEYFELTTETATALNTAKAAGKQMLAVGTTTTRVLESCADHTHRLQAQRGVTELFIQPGDTFKFVDALLTNFHLPKSSLLMLLTAFVSAPNTAQAFSSFAESAAGKAYKAAVAEGYRFFSFGDAMYVHS